MRAIALAVTCASTAAHAGGTVEVTLNEEGAAVANKIGASVTDFTANAQQKIDALFELSALPRMLRTLADTGAFADRGLGVDYQPHPGSIMIGLVAGGAIASDAGLSADRPVSATVLNYAVAVGMNLDHWSYPRWTLFANGSYAAATIRGFSGQLLATGAHVHYGLVPAVTPRVVRWTGVGVTAGLEFARWSLGLVSALKTRVLIAGTTGGEYVHMSSTGTLSVVAETLTLPIEMTTGIQIADAIGCYGGGGLNVTIGKSAIETELDADLSIDAGNTSIGSAHIAASASNGPTAVSTHVLAGIQILTRYVRIYIQGAASSASRNVALGLRAVL